MTQTSLLITAALLFGAAVYAGTTKPRKDLSQSFIDEVCEILVTISTFCFMVGILFF